MILTPRGLRVGARLLPCTIGRGGLTGDKAEGDGATPRGRHAITGLLYRPDRMAPPAAWARPIRLGDLWSDDPLAPDYNAPVRAPYPHSHERMRRADGLYDLVLLTDWNWQGAVPGAGSAIFLHAWRGPGRTTEGCIALAPGDLLSVVRHCPPGSRLIVP